MAIWEVITPRRALTQPKADRWVGNLGIVVLNTAVLRVIFPTAAAGAAAFAQAQGWGVLNLVSWPSWVEFLLALLVLDFVIYLQHVMFHAIPMFWRLHRMHHADLDFDVTTGNRFHPIEIVLSMVIKFGIVLALGPAVMAVIVFEIVLNASAMFNHSNVHIPTALDRWLRLVIVTPDMHRVHHSIRCNETNSNFGFNLPWWDRLLGTYLPQPRDGHTGMTVGIDRFRDAAWSSSLPAMLRIPFVREMGDYPINRRPM
jgi:sterol desaturase/sphingolipid hydroxylase (fatty acid hydroxylase superfamily)